MSYLSDQLIKKALEKEAADVYPRDLWRGIAGKLGATLNNAVESPPSLRRRRRLIPAAAGGLAAALVVLGVYIYFPPGIEPVTTGKDAPLPIHGGSPGPLRESVPVEEWIQRDVQRGEIREINLAAASKWVGFEIQLPKSPLVADVVPRIIMDEVGAQYMDSTPVGPEPLFSKSVAEVTIIYPNWLSIRIAPSHPDWPTLNYRAWVERDNGELRELGNPGGALWELTTVNGMEGKQIDKSRLFNVRPQENGPPQIELREMRGPQVIWYDRSNWAEYRVSGPSDMRLDELRAIVDSIYR